MDLSIIIVNYNTGKLTKQCIKSILASNPKVDFEIIVVDNSSSDDSVEMLRADFSDIKILESPNLGLAHGINLAMKKAKGEYILNLNPDVMVIDDAITKMIKFMRENPKAGVVGAKLVNPNGTIQRSCFRFITPSTILYRRTFLGKLPWAKRQLSWFLMEDWDHLSAKKVGWMLLACIMVRKKAILEVGLVDERYFLYFEDVDWCRRFWEKGYEVIYFPFAEMAHYHKRSSAEKNVFISLFNKTTRIHISSALKYLWKFKGHWKFPQENL